MKIEKSTLIQTILFLGISFAAVLESFRVKKLLSTLDYFSPLRPDNYLYFLGGAIAFITILFFVRDVFLPSHHTISKAKLQIFTRDTVKASVLFIFCFILLIEWFGALLSTFIFYFIFLRWAGRYSYINTVIISIIVTVGYYLVFVKGFDVVLPTGILETLVEGLKRTF